MNPLVTVNILSYNRKDELRNTLTKVYEQDYKNIEVIVVDNASADGSPEMVEKEFPDVILIKLDKNIGIAGWNKGFEIAKGEYVLVLDDDSYPGHLTIDKGIKLFTDDKIGIVAFEIYNNAKKQIENYYPDSGFINTFIGCGALIRKSVIVSVKGFNEILFLYSHEIEYSMRTLKSGFRIYFAKNIRVVHLNSPMNRGKIFNKGTADSRRTYYGVRNRLIILYLYFPLKKTIFRMARIMSGHFFNAAKSGLMRQVLRGIVSFISLLPKLSSQRNLLPIEIQKEYGFGNFAGGFFY